MSKFTAEVSAGDDLSGEWDQDWKEQVTAANDRTFQQSAAGPGPISKLSCSAAIKVIKARMKKAPGIDMVTNWMLVWGESALRGPLLSLFENMWKNNVVPVGIAQARVAYIYSPCTCAMPTGTTLFFHMFSNKERVVPESRLRATFTRAIAVGQSFLLDIRAWLENTFMHPEWNGVTGPPVTPKEGLKQGCVLSPILCIVFKLTCQMFPCTHGWLGCCLWRRRRSHSGREQAPWGGSRSGWIGLSLLSSFVMTRPSWL